MINVQAFNNAHWENWIPGTVPHAPVLPDMSRLGNLLPADAQVLDIGCGDGDLAGYIHEQSPTYHIKAIDINPAAIQANKEHYPDLDFSVQDVSKGMDAKDASVDLFLSRFVLTSLHRSSWLTFSQEIERLAAKNSLVWLAEPLTNDSYTERSKLAEPIVGEPNMIFSFTDPELSRSITTTEGLQQALHANKVTRIGHTYTESELLSLFPGFEPLDITITDLPSPSGNQLRSAVMLLQKTA